MISVTFDQNMWTGSPTATAADQVSDLSSVLNPANFTFTSLDPNTNLTLQPQSIIWNAQTRTAMLSMADLPAGQYQLQISGNLRSSTQVRLANSYISTFTAVLDMTSQLKLDFTNTRANRADGSISYDVSITNIGTDDLRGPLTLLLDPGRYFQGTVMDSVAGSGNQSDLWVMDLIFGLQALGGQLTVGATLGNETVTVKPASSFGTLAGAADLVKVNLGHGVYAVPQENILPTLAITGATDPTSNALPVAIAGAAWSADLTAADADGNTVLLATRASPGRRHPDAVGRQFRPTPAAIAPRPH